MDERNLSEEELAGVSGGADASKFPQLVDGRAWTYGCSSCPHSNIYSKRYMCTEVYYEILARFSNNLPIGESCPRRG